jgi:hypothetical protein
MIRLLPLLASAFLLAACPPGSSDDHFQLALDNTWEYFLVDGGEDGEFWTLTISDADENEESGRGDLFFEMVRTVPDALGIGVPADYPQRRFNLALEQDLTGSTPKPIGWTYRWLPDAQKEGGRGEYFVVSPGSAADWSDDWSYDFGEGSGSDFALAVTTERSETARQTSFGTFDDLILVERTVVITSFSSGEELVQTTVTSETWAAGVGLIHFHILAADGATTEAVLRTTNVTTPPGT